MKYPPRRRRATASVVPVQQGAHATAVQQLRYVLLAQLLRLATERAHLAIQVAFPLPVARIACRALLVASLQQAVQAARCVKQGAQPRQAALSAHCVTQATQLQQGPHLAASAMMVNTQRLAPAPAQHARPVRSRPLVPHRAQRGAHAPQALVKVSRAQRRRIVRAPLVLEARPFQIRTMTPSARRWQHAL